MDVGKKPTKNHLDSTALKRQVQPGNSEELLVNEDPGIDVSPQVIFV